MEIIKNFFSYVKFCAQGIKFSSNQSGVSYLIDEAGVRTCWDSFKTFNEMKHAGNAWKARTQLPVNANRKPCYCEAGTCVHRKSEQVFWNSMSKDDTIR